ncbi:hypothetical protein [Streptomyces sp. NPDC002851]
MPLQNSPLWWLFAAAGAGLWIVTMRAAMPTRAYKLFVSAGPLAAILPIAGFSAAYDEPLVEMLPVYCALVLSGPLGILGHRKALREVLADPNIPYEEASGPWTIQFAAALVALLGAAIYYVTH